MLLQCPLLSTRCETGATENIMMAFLNALNLELEGCIAVKEELFAVTLSA